jgi:hypothetical protein
MSKQLCEFCWKPVHSRAGDTVCMPCHRKLEADFVESERKRSEAWGQKYKCRRCASPLPLSRRLVCLHCIPQDFMPSADVVWDGATPTRDDEVGLFDAPKPNLPVGQDKKCRKCHVTKDLSQFGSHGETKDKYHNHCKSCVNAYYRTYAQTKKLARKVRQNDLSKV